MENSGRIRLKSVGGSKRLKMNHNDTMSEHGRGKKANFSTIDSFNAGSCGIADVEKQYRESLSKSQNKLTKNYGRIYNKITLEKMMEQKKLYVETALNPKYVPYAKLKEVNDKKKEIEMVQ